MFLKKVYASIYQCDFCKVLLPFSTEKSMEFVRGISNEVQDLINKAGLPSIERSLLVGEAIKREEEFFIMHAKILNAIWLTYFRREILSRYTRPLKYVVSFISSIYHI